MFYVEYDIYRDHKSAWFLVKIFEIKLFRVLNVQIYFAPLTCNKKIGAKESVHFKLELTLLLFFEY